jgi:hypothetical protein
VARGSASVGHSWIWAAVLYLPGEEVRSSPCGDTRRYGAKDLLSAFSGRAQSWVLCATQPEQLEHGALAWAATQERSSGRFGARRRSDLAALPARRGPRSSLVANDVGRLQAL